jgi:hypothetical protein
MSRSAFPDRAVRMLQSPRPDLTRAILAALSLWVLLALVTASPPRPLAVLGARLDGYVMAVQPVIANQKLWFDLDTGGLHTIVDSSAAKALQLRSAGSLQIGGAGKGAVQALKLSPFAVRLKTVTFYPKDPLALDLSRTGSVIGTRGLLGFDLFSQYVVEYDYDRTTVALYDPASYRYAGAGARIPLVIRPPRAFVSVVVSAPGVAPERHLLRVDTGSSDSVDDDIILRSNEPKRIVTGGVGIGSRFKTYIGTISSLQIGPYVLHQNLVSATGGVQLIGGDVWHRFNIVFDFAHRCMYLAPRRHFTKS